MSLSTFELPRINGATEAEQLVQIKKYLYEVVQQMNWAFNNIGTGSEAVVNAVKSSGVIAPKDTPQATFNSIKALIIKSADIVNAYYEEINKKLEGVYVAESEFGTFVEETEGEFKASSTEFEQIYENIQAIQSSVKGISDAMIETNAYIKSGLLYYDDSGVPVYGLEVGQQTEKDGVEVFNRYAQFTSDRLVFFDSNGNEVAWIKDNTLHIEVAEIATLRQGGFESTAEAGGGVVERWVGTGG